MEDVALVNKARRALANSYVFAYYAFDPSSPLSGTKLTLFQDKQQQLEQEVSRVRYSPPSSQKKCNVGCICVTFDGY